MGTIAITPPKGRGTIVETHTLLQMVKVKVRLEDDIEELFTYRIDEIIMTKEKES